MLMKIQKFEMLTAKEILGKWYGLFESNDVI